MEKYIDEGYKLLEKAIKKYGSFHKVLFHLHTPASHDYKMLELSGNKRNVKDFSNEELFDIFAQTQIFNREQIRGCWSKNYFDIEILPYYIIAAYLIINDIEMVVISDHNTISGFKLLEEAVNNLYRMSTVCQKHKYPEIMLGIEISCADKNHVVAIFDKNNKDSLTQLKNYLDDKLMNEELGTYQTSYDVMKFVLDNGGISYIAHANTSAMFTDESFLSMAYKKKLFESKVTNLLGIKQSDQDVGIRQMISRYTKKDIAFVYDSDSHGIDTINRLFFWIKGDKCDFKMLKAAFADPDISIRLNKPESPNAYIKGIFIKSSHSAFLYDAQLEEDMCIPFSKELNCLIGGRGSGKSTIINIIEAVLRQHYKSLDIMNAILEYDVLAVFIYLDGNSYLVSFQPPKDEKNIEFLNYLWQYENSDKILQGQWKKGLRIEIKKENTNLRKELLKYVHLFEIHEKSLVKMSIGCYRHIFEKILSQSYSINELVQMADKKDTVERYVKTVLLSNPKFKDIPQFTREKDNDMNFDKLRKIQEKRKNQILSIIEEFNSDEYQKDKLKIVYQIRNLGADFIDFERILKSMPQFSHTFFRLHDKEYNITIEGFLAGIDNCCRRIGVFDFLQLIMKSDYSAIRAEVEINKFCQEITQQDIDNGIISMGTEDEINIIKEVVNYINRNYHTQIIEKLDNDYLEYCDSYTIEFNVSNRENVEKRKPCFRDITTLSLGQKVVALLSFILGYSKYAEDFRPLIIDQPEDNLDSQYIYKNLVQELRTIKGKRQVIVATHNATIVTNAKADQVIVMDSNGEHGWLKKFGYSNSSVIKKEIINYLEGGIESFKHKEAIYKDVLN